MTDSLTQLVADVAAREAHVNVLSEMVIGLEKLVADQQAVNIELRNKLAVCEALPTSVPPSGKMLPIGDLPGWKQIYATDFAGIDAPIGTLTATRGQPLPGTNGLLGAYPVTYPDTSRNGIYDTARTLSIQGGILRKRLHTHIVPRVCALVPWILGPDKTKWNDPDQFWPDQLYGRYLVRFRIPRPIPGYKIAWLLWPEVGSNTAGNPAGGGNGEIDFPEMNLDTADKVGGFVHHMGATVGNDQYAMPPLATNLAEWHDAVIEWMPSRVRFLWDGVVIGIATTRIPSTRMHWVLQTETKIQTAKPPVESLGDIEIAHLAAWSYAP